jgi:hypothetical protein
LNSKEYKELINKVINDCYKYSTTINPKRPAPTGYPSTEEQPKYPQEVLKEFTKTENFVSLAKDTKFIQSYLGMLCRTLPT